MHPNLAQALQGNEALLVASASQLACFARSSTWLNWKPKNTIVIMQANGKIPKVRNLVEVQITVTRTAMNEGWFAMSYLHKGHKVKALYLYVCISSSHGTSPKRHGKGHAGDR